MNVETRELFDSFKHAQHKIRSLGSIVQNPFEEMELTYADPMEWSKQFEDFLKELTTLKSSVALHVAAHVGGKNAKP